MDLDSLIFLFFLFMNLLVGMRAIRHPSIPYARFNTANIIATIMAITYGGEILSNPPHIGSVLGLTGSAISYFIIANLLIYRLHLLLNRGSVAEMMGRLYGKLAREVVAISGLLHTTAVAAMQFKLLAMAIGWFFTIQADYSLLIAAFFITFSIGSNNIESPTLVRVVRCATFGILLPMIAWTLWSSMVTQYNADQVNLILAIKRSWNTLIHFHAAPLDYIAYLIAFSIPAFFPVQVKPMLIAENVTQIKRSFNGAGLLLLAISFFILWVTLLVEHHDSKLLISAIPLTTFDAYVGLKALFMIAIASLTTSTAGANLHAATGLMSNDLSYLFKWIKQPIMYRAIAGMIGTLFALCAPDQLIWMAIILFKTTVSLPLLLSLTGICLHRHAVLAGMLASVLTTIGWFFWASNPAISSLLPAMLMNLITSMLVQFLTGNQITYQQNLPNRLAQERVAQVPPLWQRMAKYITQKMKQFNFWDYLDKQLPKDNLPYLFFIFYILLTGYGSFYTFSSNTIWHTSLEVLILFPSLLVSTFFLVYTFILPQLYIRKLTSIIWPLSHIYFLFLVGTAMPILSKFAYLHDVIFILNLTLSIFITPLLVILFGSMMSVLMVWGMLHYMHSDITWIDCFLDLNIRIVYAILLLFVLVGGLVYHKKSLSKLLSIIQALTSEKEEQNARQFFNKQQVDALAYESSCIISQLNNQLIRLEQSEERQLAYSEQAIRLKKYFNSIFKHLKYNLHLTTNWISIDQLLAQCFDAIKTNNIYDVPYVMIDTKQLYIQCAVESIKNLIINSLYSCTTHQSLHSDQRKDIYIYIDDTQLGYRLTLLEGKLQKIKAISFVITTATRLPVIHPLYKVAEMADIQISNGHEDKGDSEHQHIVHAHYGYYERFSSESEITYLYVIPVNVKEITKAFATLSPVVYTQRMVLDPVSMKEEATFIEKVKQKKGLNIDAIMDALQLIKIYYTTQRRKTGELFYLHPMAVASILLTITDESNVIIAGLLHDVVQNTPLTEAGLTTLFGTSITQTVMAAARLEKELLNQKGDYNSYIKRITSDKNHDAMLVRLADVLHNARTISGHTIEKQIEKARLIQNFYLPLAMQIQLVDITHELQLHTEKVFNIAMVKH
ncbi:MULTISPECIES: HD domain-containing protein [Candidatus Cardinium]|uniref:HD domain-containing protein n=1 Tax=Candidatus Cardinium TaxID=273135 RepID=UPI001FAA821C|nr:MULTISPECIES: HD domain-containing protein [Cardinium]